MHVSVARLWQSLAHEQTCTLHVLHGSSAYLTAVQYCQPRRLGISRHLSVALSILLELSPEWKCVPGRAVGFFVLSTSANRRCSGRSCLRHGYAGTTLANSSQTPCSLTLAHKASYSQAQSVDRTLVRRVGERKAGALARKVCGANSKRFAAQPQNPPRIFTEACGLLTVSASACGRREVRLPATMATHGGALGVCKEVVSHELLDESSAFLESLRLAATTGKVCVGAFVPHSLK